jgi:chaperonin GroES
VSIKPTGDQICLKVIDEDGVTPGGLVIPDTAKKKSQRGTVIAVGPGRIDNNGNRIEPDVQMGDVVIFPNYGGSPITYNGEEYVIFNSRDVLATVH